MVNNGINLACVIFFLYYLRFGICYFFFPKIFYMHLHFSAHMLKIFNPYFIQAFGVDIFFHQVWKDPRVKIPPSHNTTRLVLDSKWRHHLWTPDTYFKNLLDGKVNDIIIPYSYMVVDSKSNLFFAAR